jgi:DNA-binding Lrp family transcriptional regulator
MAKLDLLDLKILSYLQSNGRISITELSEKVDSSRPTVTNRLKRLLEKDLVSIKSGFNLKKFGYKMASVGLEVKKDDIRKQVEDYLISCPRVLNIFRTPDKANIHVSVWGEEDQTISSTVESFRDFPNVEIVYTHYLGTPIHGTVVIGMPNSKEVLTPCGRNCKECHRFINEWCVGCPSSENYHNDFLK